MRQPNILQVLKFSRVGGVELGVLEDGQPFVTSSGLATLCGVPVAAIRELTSEAPPAALLRQVRAGDADDVTYLARRALWGNKVLLVHDEHASTALIGYHAFEVGTARARETFVELARENFRSRVERALGVRCDMLPWTNLLERVQLNDDPPGFFSVWTEIAAPVLVPAQRHGLKVDEATLPDISVGTHWSRQWVDQDLARSFGERRRWRHNFPASFPQSAAAVAAWVYPTSALGAFRTWLERVYLLEKFPTYLRGKVRSGRVKRHAAESILAACRRLDR